MSAPCILSIQVQAEPDPEVLAIVVPAEAPEILVIVVQEGNGSGTVAWVDVSGKPAEFPPEDHSHAIGDVTGLQDELDGKAEAEHSHAIGDVTGLQDELDGKAEAVHSHAIGDVTGLQDELDGKAEEVHGHAIGDVTGLQDELDGKAEAAHGHAIGDVTGLQDELDGKAEAVHDHDGVIGITIDGAGSPITTGIKGDCYVPYGFEIIGAVLQADQAGDVVIDVWVAAAGATAPVVGDSITASARPTLSGARYAADTTLTGWIKTHAGGRAVRWNVVSAATITRLTASVLIRKAS